MNKNASYIILFGILAFAALAFMFYSSDLYGKAGYIGAMIFEGRIDDANGKPIWGGSIVAVAVQQATAGGGSPAVGRSIAGTGIRQVVAHGKIKGAYRLHFYTTFEKDLRWYKDKPVYIYVNGKLCTTLDLYKFVQERGGVIAQARLNLKCQFALPKGRYA